jgi:hypothetical protein
MELSALSEFDPEYVEFTTAAPSLTRRSMGTSRAGGVVYQPLPQLKSTTCSA